MMTKFIAALIACVMVAACAPLPSDSGDGIGGTGVVASTDGIGGTGHRDPDDDDGIGGTGYGGDDDGIGGTGLWASAEASGDVAVLGVITGLNELVVNGHGMFVGDATTITLNGEPSAPADLALGQVVAVRAGIIDGVIMAKAIEGVDVVVGPVAGLAGEPDKFVVLGQTIHVGALTRRELAGRDLPRAGDVVRISGLRRLDGSIEASLIRAAGPNAVYSVTGATHALVDGKLAIANLDIDTTALAFDLADSALATITGEFRDGQFVAQDVKTRPALPFRGEVSRWSIQGYAAPDGDAQIRLGGFPSLLEAGPGRQAIGHGVDLDRRVIIELRGDGSAVQVDRVRPAPVVAPDAGTFIPRYAPGLMQPDVVIAPGLPTQPVNPEPVITLPQDLPTVRQPVLTRPSVLPSSRPASPPIRSQPLPPVHDIPAVPPVVVVPPAPAPAPAVDIMRVPAMDTPAGMIR